MLSCNDFVFIKDEQGKYKLVDCSSHKHRTWKTIDDWTEYDKNEQIVVFVYEGKIMSDTFFFTLAFTTKDNFEKRFSKDFDFNKICKIGADKESFSEVQEYLCCEFGYNKQNIFEETGDTSRKYKLGIFNI